ncbi:hypothetical protein LTR84_011620 [Exophiala bonariae]|uniref:Arrestin-like N-terminal domain-containing protein n=1 Tax=Exophiala bonariae TaxID=1690606 RepID=A0AAV9NHY4_9EURO|nr:hypothetical protein LTR84_011620 [Exophiala bonariae]
MIYAKLQISAPTGEVTTSSGRHRVSGRLSVLDDSVRRHGFDTVQLCFRGVIASCIGQKTCLEDIITLTDIKAAGDFRPHMISSQKYSTKGHYVDFFFQLPTHASPATGLIKTLPLTTIVEGSTSVTHSTAMNDRQVIQGECEVSYWIEAQFRSRGEQVGSLNQPVRISAIYPDLQLSLSHGEPLTIQASPDLLTRCKLQKCPTLSVSMYEPNITTKRDPGTAKRQISIPIAVAIDWQELPRGNDHFDSRQSFKCSVEAKWLVKDRFSIAPVRGKDRILLRGEVIHRTSMASAQKSNILFRPLPLYDDPNMKKGVHKRASYIGASELELCVPSAISQPSLCWNHFSRAYALELSLTFQNLQGASKYKVHSVIPVSVATQDVSVEKQKDEAILSIVESELDGFDGEELAVDQRDMPEPPNQGQRLTTRTPPPAYFR